MDTKKSITAINKLTLFMNLKAESKHRKLTRYTGHVFFFLMFYVNLMTYLILRKMNEWRRSLSNVRQGKACKL